MTRQIDLFGTSELAPGTAAALPEGFRYRSDLISPSDEAALLERIEVDALRYSITFRNLREG